MPKLNEKIIKVLEKNKEKIISLHGNEIYKKAINNELSMLELSRTISSVEKK